MGYRPRVLRPPTSVEVLLREHKACRNVGSSFLPSGLGIGTLTLDVLGKRDANGS